MKKLYTVIKALGSYWIKPIIDCYCCCVVGRLTWLVYIIGSVIGGRVSFASTDEHDAMDGELVCRYSIGCNLNKG